jgi:hypothetical protein
MESIPVTQDDKDHLVWLDKKHVALDPWARSINQSMNGERSWNGLQVINDEKKMIL